MSSGLSAPASIRYTCGRPLVIMIKLERLFSKDQSIESEDEEICDNEMEPSKSDIPFNKAFLSLALVEPQRTISYSLDELDRCIMNKAILMYTRSDHFNNHHDKEDSRKVNFVNSPNMYSLSTISEHSDSTLSPIIWRDPQNHKGSLEVALETLSSNLSEEAMQTSLENSDIAIEIKKSVSVTDTVETINSEKPLEAVMSASEDITDFDNDYSSEDDLSHPKPKDLFLQLKKLPSSDELVIFQKRESLDDQPKMSDLETNDKEFQYVKQSTEFNDKHNHPKGILKNKGYKWSGLQSEPISRRYTVAPNQFFGRDIKSVSHVCDSPSQRIFPQKPKVKKHSAPARMPLTKMKSALKINRKFLSSLQQTDNSSEELIELLVKQAELLNQGIKHRLLLNALQYGGIAVFAILVTCASLRYCIKYKKCD